MSKILQLTKSLESPPEIAELTDYAIRQFQWPDDRWEWLTLRERAFADESPRPRSWSPDDFAREFCQQWWWRPDWFWLAKLTHNATPTLTGAIGLGLRGTRQRHVAVMHWLMVDPQHRGRGLALRLLATLEQAAVAAGYRELRLETHSGWISAVRFYQSVGFRALH